MKRKVFLRMTCSLLIFLFGYAAFSKLLHLGKFTDVLWQTPFAGYAAPIVALAVPLTELGIVVLLLFPKTRLAGLYASLGLLLLFTAYLGYMLAFALRLPCQCGGIISQLSWKAHLILNLAFAVLAMLGIRHERAPKAHEQELLRQ